MNTQLIPVFAGELSGAPVQLVDARLLHSFLEIGKDFSTWIKARIDQYGFMQGIDFNAPQNGGTLESSTYGKDKIDYHLSIDMAKELGMIERNEKGRQIRRYFLDMEQLAKTGSYGIPQETHRLIHALQTELLKKSPRTSKVYKLQRAGFSKAETAKMLGVSKTTIRVEFKTLKGWGYALGGAGVQLDVSGGV